MSGKRLIKDDLRYILFTEMYHKVESPKAKRKAFGILESAVQCIAHKGFDALTFEMVARDAGVTRPLVKHYFTDKNDLRWTAIKYIRLLFQKLAVDQMQKAKTEDQMLRLYLQSCFQWVDTFRTHAIAWFFFLNHCSGNKANRELNTAAVEVGEERIRALLERGRESGAFRFTDAHKLAKQIQVLITGAMIVYASENLKDEKTYREWIIEMALNSAGARTLS